MRTSPLYKLILAILLLLVFIAIFCVLFLNQLSLQLIGFLLVSGILILQTGLRKYLHELRNIVPFAGLLMAVYLLFGFFGLRMFQNIQSQETIFHFWMHYGLVRVLLLMTTILLLRLIFSWFSLDDLAGLPLRINQRKYLILGMILYNYAFKYIPELIQFQEAIPLYQHCKQSISHRFHKRLVLILALLILVIRQAKNKGELIDNRILHCYKGDER